MLLTSACGDAILLRCLSWQVDAMLAVTVRVAVTWPGRDGLSPAVLLHLLSWQVGALLATTAAAARPRETRSGRCAARPCSSGSRRRNKIN